MRCARRAGRITPPTAPSPGRSAERSSLPAPLPEVAMRLRNVRPRSLVLLGATAVLGLGLVAPASAAPVARSGSGGNPATAVRPVLRGIDLESATIPDLQRAMNRGRLSSVQLTSFYLRRIRAL